MITALILPILIPVAGMAIDLSGMMNARAKMRNASDAASLAAASALAERNVTETEAKAIALRYLKGHSDGDFDFATGATISIDTTGSTGAKTFKVTVVAKYQYELSPMTSLVVPNDEPIQSKSVSISTQEVQTTKSPASLYLVLDRSGSMGDNTNEVIGYDNKGKKIYRIKIEALKLAVSKMSDVLHKVDPTWTYVRTGAVAFSTNEFPSTKIDWGTTGVVDYVSDFTDGGSTNPVQALGTATTKLIDPKENAEHLKKNGGNPSKAIIYMTDGQNNPKSLDSPAQAKCTAAKKAGLEIYTIGFMMGSGQDFLAECATDAKHFFDAQDASDLYAAFEKIGLATASKLTNRIGE